MTPRQSLEVFSSNKTNLKTIYQNEKQNSKKEETTLTGDEKILIVHKNEKVIKEIDPSLLQTNTTCLALKKQGSLSILTLGLIEGDNW